MQLNGNTAGEYMSRKYTLTLLALVVVCIKLLTCGAAESATWAIPLTGAIVGILGQYGYFNTKETSAVKDLKMAGMANDVTSSPPKPPIEDEAK